MKFMLKCVPAVTLLALLVSATPAEASSIQVSGSTQGCFGTGCSDFGSPKYSGATNDLTFTGSSFAVTTDASGFANVSLGTFGRGNTNVDDTSPLDFTLKVTFTLPLGINGSPATFTAFINGTTPGGGGAELINFDNTPILFTYANGTGSGSFYFAVANDPLVTKNTTTNPIALTGTITGATFTETVNEGAVVATPEPSTWLLIGTGVALVAARRRRR